jgi:hypothetical protein
MKPVCSILNSCNCVVCMTDMNLTIRIEHNTVEYFTLNFHAKGKVQVLSRYMIFIF